MPKISVERSTLIQSPVHEVFANVRNFHQWPAWSPWLMSEPDCKVTFAADGNSYTWKGEIIGEGSLSILTESEDEFITLDLVFLKPWKSKARVEFRFSSSEGQTRVSWKMDSSLPFFLFWMKGMMTGMIGMDYERGLSMLKDLTETGQVPTRLEFSGRESFPGFSYVGIRTNCTIADLGSTMEADFGRLKDAISTHGIVPAGPPFSIYEKWGVSKGEARYVLGIPVAEKLELPAELTTGEIPPCETFAIRHIGNYRHLGNAWSAIFTRVQAKKMKCKKGIFPFETYDNDPDEVPENETITTVRMPVQ